MDMNTFGLVLIFIFIFIFIPLLTALWIGRSKEDSGRHNVIEYLSSKISSKSITLVELVHLCIHDKEVKEYFNRYGYNNWEKQQTFVLSCLFRTSGVCGEYCILDFADKAIWHIIYFPAEERAVEVYESNLMEISQKRNSRFRFRKI